MNTLIAVTGCVAAYKAPSIIRGCLKRTDLGISVKAMMSEKARDFITPDSIISALEDPEDFYEEKPGQSIHIDASDWAHCFWVVPATANTIAKLAHGTADNLVTLTALALQPDCDKVLAPAMNTRMWENDTVQGNLHYLMSQGWKIIEPVEGKLACGTVGKGKLASTKPLVDSMIDLSQNA